MAWITVSRFGVELEMGTRRITRRESGKNGEELERNHIRERLAGMDGVAFGCWRQTRAERGGTSGPGAVNGCRPLAPRWPEGKTPRCGVSVVESGGKVRYHARAHALEGEVRSRFPQVSAFWGSLEYHPGAIKRGPGYHPGVVKRPQFVPHVHILAAEVLAGEIRFVHLGHKPESATGPEGCPGGGERNHPRVITTRGKCIWGTRKCRRGTIHYAAATTYGS